MIRRNPPWKEPVNTNPSQSKCKTYQGSQQSLQKFVLPDHAKSKGSSKTGQSISLHFCAMLQPKSKQSCQSWYKTNAMILFQCVLFNHAIMYN